MVKLSKKVADAMEKIKFDLPANEKPHHWLTDWSWLYKKHENEAEILHEHFVSHPVEYMIAIVEGYQVELTPEEKFVKQYNRIKQKKRGLLSDDLNIEEVEELTAYLAGMRETLNIFGIEIEGINV